MKLKDFKNFQVEKIDIELKKIDEELEESLSKLNIIFENEGGRIAKIGSKIKDVYKEMPKGKKAAIAAGTTAAIAATALAYKKIKDARKRKEELLKAVEDQDQREAILHQIKMLKQKEEELKS